ncbi:hypothetical protein TNIN_192031 [Trichonephila inaurata madagascariensis]|uniref:Uncharacterized protein n=1 Tax=Trichonephila inaurata madagascariensis TaxID=2747483 RepID=A0A8X7CIK8_9ARAC|nr:hypothetical protein TNIN_192031 [Trichonephila inaurata madagascariensis]
MPRKNLSVQEALAIFEELPSDDDSAASNNKNNDDEDYVENVAQGKNVSSDDEEIYEIQCPSTSQPEVNRGKLKKKKISRLYGNISQSKQKVVCTGDALLTVPEKTFIALDSCVGPVTYLCAFHQMALLALKSSTVNSSSKL